MPHKPIKDLIDRLDREYRERSILLAKYLAALEECNEA